MTRARLRAAYITLALTAIIVQLILGVAVFGRSTPSARDQLRHATLELLHARHAHGYVTRTNVVRPDYGQVEVTISTPWGDTYALLHFYLEDGRWTLAAWNCLDYRCGPSPPRGP